MIIFLLLCNMCTLLILKSEIHRGRYPDIQVEELKTGDLIYFSSRPVSLFRELKTLWIRFYFQCEFDHIGIVLRISDDLYVLDRRLNGSVTLVKLKERIKKIHGYVAIRPLHKKLSSKKTKQLLQVACQYVSSVKKKCPLWRYMYYIQSNNIFHNPWYLCHDMLSEIFIKVNLKFPNIFPRHQNHSNILYNHFHMLIA